MKTLAVALVFCLSMVSLFAAVRADARSAVRMEPGLSRPEPLSLLPKGDGDDDKGGDDDDDDEEDEEEYRAAYAGLSQSAALELVDPGALKDVLRMQAGVRFGHR